MLTETSSLSISEALNAATKKVLQFNGRSRRSEFWWTQLIVYLVSIAISYMMEYPYLLVFILDLLTVPLTVRRLHDTGRSGWWMGVDLLMRFAILILFLYDITMYAINTVELGSYDWSSIAELSIKYILFLLVFIVYQIILLIFCCLDSDKTENQYGLSPKYTEYTPDDTDKKVCGHI